VDRWVAEGADGTADRATLQPAGYDPFYGTGAFIRAMWETYRNP
jgi:hypothetical protein